MSKDAYFRPNEHKSPFDVGTNLFVPKNSTDKSAPTLFEQYQLEMVLDIVLRVSRLNSKKIQLREGAVGKTCPTNREFTSVKT